MSTESIHRFTLRFSLPEYMDGEAAVQALGQAGLDDVLAGIGMPGRIALDFDRPGSDRDRVIQMAMIEVLRALPDVKLMAAEADDRT